MTREEWKEMLPLLKEWVEGRAELQFKSEITGKWEDLDKKESVVFGCPPFRYRLKSRPREFWLVRQFNSDGQAGSIHVNPVPLAGNEFREVIHVREVLEQVHHAGNLTTRVE